MHTTANLLTEQISRRVPSAETALELHYGEIGIACVAAAARYRTGAKNPGAQDGLIERCDPAPRSWH